MLGKETWFAMYCHCSACKARPYPQPNCCNGYKTALSGACRGGCQKPFKLAVPVYSRSPYFQTPTGCVYIGGSTDRPIRNPDVGKYCCQHVH